LWWILLTVLPLALFGAIIASPSFADLLEGLVGTRTTTEATSTSEPVDTPLPTEPKPTATLVPTPISLSSEGCPSVSLHAPIFQGNSVEWRLDNQEDEPVEFALRRLTIPKDDFLQTMKLWIKDELIWEGDVPIGEAEEGQIDLGEDVRQELPVGSLVNLRLEFNWKPPTTGFGLELDFGEACLLSGDWR
jgi:hypothetical protein